MLKTVAGLGAAIALLPTMAHADPVAKFGQTIYPPRVTSVPAATPAPPPPPTPVVQAEAGRKRHRHLARLRTGRADQMADAAAPVETTPAPTPVAPKAKDGVTQVLSGPHEEAAPTLRDLVSRHARENGVPEKLASAVVSIESRFNPNARGGHALGLMQIQFATARAEGFAGSARGLLEPETNLHYGMKVLADAFKASKGDVCLTLAKYQSGHLTTRVSASNRAYCSRARALMAKA